MAQDQVVSLIIKVLGDSNLGAAEKDLLKLHKNLERLTKEFAKAAKAGGFDKNLPGMQQLFESFKNGKVSASKLGEEMQKLQNATNQFIGSALKGNNKLGISQNALNQAVVATQSAFAGVKKAVDPTAFSEAGTVLGKLGNDFKLLKEQAQAGFTKDLNQQFERLAKSVDLASRKNSVLKASFDELGKEIKQFATETKSSQQAQKAHDAALKSSQNSAKVAASSFAALKEQVIGLREASKTATDPKQLAAIEKQIAGARERLTTIRNDLSSQIANLRVTEKATGAGDKLSKSLVAQRDELTGAIKNWGDYNKRIGEATVISSQHQGIISHTNQILGNVGNVMGGVTNAITAANGALERQKTLTTTDLAGNIKQLESSWSKAKNKADLYNGQLKQIDQTMATIQQTAGKTDIGKALLGDLGKLREQLQNAVTALQAPVGGAPQVKQLLDTFKQINAQRQEAIRHDQTQNKSAQKLQDTIAKVETNYKNISREVAETSKAISRFKFDPASLEKFQQQLSTMKKADLLGLRQELKDAHGTLGTVGQQIKNTLSQATQQGVAGGLEAGTKAGLENLKRLVGNQRLGLEQLLGQVSKEIPMATQLRDMGSLASNVATNFRDLNKQSTILSNLTGKFFNMVAKNKNLPEQTFLRMAAAQKELETNLMNSQSQFNEMAMGMMVLGQAMAAPFIAAIKITAEFSDMMGMVQGVTNATEAQFVELKDTAKLMGATTRFTALEAAEGLKFLGMAGFTANNAIKALPTTLNLAMAAGMDLGRTADVVTNIMTPFQIQARELPKTADILTKAFTTSNSTLQELGFAFKFVGSLAKGLDADFVDLTGAMALLHNAGFKATMAGTALRTALDSMFNPTAAEARVMKELGDRIGVAGFQITDANGRFVGFTKIVKQLEQAGFTSAEALKLFGQRGGPGMASLLRVGSEAMEDYNDKLENSVGTTDRIASTMENTLQGAFLRVMSASEALGEDIGESLTPTLIGLSNVIANFINSFLAFRDSLGSFTPIFDHFITVVGGLAAAIGAMSFAWAFVLVPVRKFAALMKTFLVTTGQTVAAVELETKARFHNLTILDRQNGALLLQSRLQRKAAAEAAAKAAAEGGAGAAGVFANIAQISKSGASAVMVKISAAMAAMTASMQLFATNVRSASGAAGKLSTIFSGIAGFIAMAGKALLKFPIKHPLITAVALLATIALWPKRVEQTNIELEKQGRLLEAQKSDLTAHNNLYQKSVKRAEDLKHELRDVNAELERAGDADRLGALAKAQRLELGIEINEAKARERLFDLIEFLNQDTFTTDAISLDFNIDEATGNLNRLNAVIRKTDSEFGVVKDQVIELANSTGEFADNIDLVTRILQNEKSNQVLDSQTDLLMNITNEYNKQNKLLSGANRLMNGTREQIKRARAELEKGGSGGPFGGGLERVTSEEDINKLEKRIATAGKNIVTQNRVVKGIISQLIAQFHRSGLTFAEYRTQVAEQMQGASKEVRDGMNEMLNRIEEGSEHLAQVRFTISTDALIGRLSGLANRVEKQLEDTITKTNTQVQKFRKKLDAFFNLDDAIRSGDEKRFKLRFDFETTGMEQDLQGIQDKLDERLRVLVSGQQDVVAELEREGQVAKTVTLDRIGGMQRVGEEAKVLVNTEITVNKKLVQAVIENERQQLQAVQQATQQRLQVINAHFDKIVAKAEEAGVDTGEIESERTQAIKDEVQARLEANIQSFERLSDERQKLSEKIKGIEQAEASFIGRMNQIRSNLDDIGLTNAERHQQALTRSQELEAEARKAMLRGEFDVARDLAQKAATELEKFQGGLGAFDEGGIAEARQQADDLEGIFKATSGAMKSSAQTAQSGIDAAMQESMSVIRELQKTMASLADSMKSAAEATLSFGLDEAERETVDKYGVSYAILREKVLAAREAMAGFRQEMLNSKDLAENPILLGLDPDKLVDTARKEQTAKRELFNLENAKNTVTETSKVFRNIRDIAQSTQMLPVMMREYQDIAKRVAELEFDPTNEESRQEIQKMAKDVDDFGKRFTDMRDKFKLALTDPAARQALLEEGRASEEQLAFLGKTLNDIDNGIAKLGTNFSGTFEGVQNDTRLADAAAKEFKDTTDEVAQGFDQIEAKSAEAFSKISQQAEQLARDSAPALEIAMRDAITAGFKAATETDQFQIRFGFEQLKTEIDQVTSQLKTQMEMKKPIVRLDVSAADGQLDELAEKTLDNKVILDTSVAEQQLRELGAVNVNVSTSGGAVQAGQGGGIVKKMKFGGIVKNVREMTKFIVPGSGSGDKVPALLEPGEGVIRKSVVERLGAPFIEMLNRGKLELRSMGGVIGSSISNLPSFATAVGDSRSSISTETISVELNIGGSRSKLHGTRQEVKNFVTALRRTQKGT